MHRLFRLTGVKRRDSTVEAWLRQQPGELGAIARHWFAQFRACGDDVLELLHDGCPVACVEDVAFGYVNVFKVHVNVGFFLGADLPDPAHLLQGTGKRMRHVKIKPDCQFDTKALVELIDASYRDVKVRLDDAE